MKNRVAIYQREAAEMLQNIAQYPGLTEEQLCRFFSEKESTAKILLSHMLKEGRAYRADNGRYYINQEIQNGADDTLSRCIPAVPMRRRSSVLPGRLPSPARRSSSALRWTSAA